MELVIGIILLIGALFLIIAVLMQQGKQKGLSGAISGGADTFFGKQKGKTVDKILSKATTIVAVLFVALVLVMYLIQPDMPDMSNIQHGKDTPVVTTEHVHVEGEDHAAETTEAPVETTEAPAETTEAPAETTEAPAETTETPAETTETPAETTEAPAETTVAAE